MPLIVLFEIPLVSACGLLRPLLRLPACRLAHLCIRWSAFLPALSPCRITDGIRTPDPNPRN